MKRIQNLLRKLRRLVSGLARLLYTIIAYCNGCFSNQPTKRSTEYSKGALKLYGKARYLKQMLTQTIGWVIVANYQSIVNISLCNPLLHYRSLSLSLSLAYTFPYCVTCDFPHGYVVSVLVRLFNQLLYFLPTQCPKLLTPQ